MKSLSGKRRIFHSEADFQFALAWEIKELYGWEIHLEAPATIDEGTKKEKRISIDIVVVDRNNNYPIEMNYPAASYGVSIATPT